jgi:hypothetical protein
LRYLARHKEICFLIVLALWVLAACAGYAAAILYTASAQEAAALASDYPAHWPAWGSLPTEFAKLRLVLASTAAALGLAGCVLTLVLRRRSHLHLQGSGQRIRRNLMQNRRALPLPQRRLAVAVLIALTGLRLLVSRMLVTFDDTASYEYFVRKSLFVVSACYPAPNNHVFSNTLSWLFYQAYPGYWWSMRAPVLLATTAGTIGWFLGLLPRSSFRVAALAVSLFSLLELSLFYAAEGRGYALLLALSGLGFFCVLSLTYSTPQAAVSKLAGAWAGLALAGVLGLYTVPTFAYFLVAAYSWLGVYWLRKKYFQRLVSLCLLGVTTLLGAALLYAPLLVISGPGALFQNVYVKPLAASAFFRQLPAYLWRIEGALLGESHNGALASLHVGSLAAVAVIVGFGALARAAHRGRLPARQTATVLRLGVPALWFALLPYSLLLVQHVAAPDRTLLFKAAFMFVLIGLEVDWLLQRIEIKNRQLRAGLLLAAGLWVSVQLLQLYKSNQLRLSYLKTPHAAARWLLTQPPGPILVADSPWNSTYIQFFIHFEKPTSALTIDTAPRPGVRYRYRVDPPVAAPTAGSAALPHLHIGRDINSEAMNILAYW